MCSLVLHHSEWVSPLYPSVLLRSSYCPFFYWYELLLSLIDTSYAAGIFPIMKSALLSCYFLSSKSLFSHDQVCSSFYLFFLRSFSLPLCKLFPSFPENCFPLQNFDRSSVVLLLGFSTSVLLESAVLGDALCWYWILTCLTLCIWDILFCAGDVFVGSVLIRSWGKWHPCKGETWVGLCYLQMRDQGVLLVWEEWSSGSKGLD